MSATPYNGPERVVPLAERRTLIEGVLSPLSPQWEPDGSWGYVACPGAECHSNTKGRRDCRVFAVERAGHKVMPPGLFCLHTSCAGVLAAINHRIRSEIGKAKVRGVERAPPRAAGSTDQNKPRTARTDVFKAPTKQGGASRTQRTDVSKPLVRFARAQVRTHVFEEVRSDPSAPSVVASIPPATISSAAQKMPPGGVFVEKRESMPAPGAALNSDVGDESESTLIMDGVVSRGMWKNGEWISTKKL